MSVRISTIVIAAVAELLVAAIVVAALCAMN